MEKLICFYCEGIPDKINDFFVGAVSCIVGNSPSPNKVVRGEVMAEVGPHLDLFRPVTESEVCWVNSGHQYYNLKTDSFT